VYRSHRRGFTERALSLAGLKIRRCHACNLRFARFGGSVALVQDVQRVLRRLAQLALVLLGAAFILATVLWLSARQAA
jgi:hypothetical protein